jgi:hypothetical protein
VAEALTVAVAVELALRSMSLARLLRWIERLDRLAAARTDRVDGARLRRVAAGVYGLLPLRRTCLRESLVLLALLRRRGQPARLQIGVNKSGNTLLAHAWVDRDAGGRAVDASGFLPLTPIATGDRSP